MIHLELAHQTVEALERLSLDHDIRRIANGLEVMQPPMDVLHMRAVVLKNKLASAMRHAIILEHLLRRNNENIRGE
jgi:hypothetical protein